MFGYRRGGKDKSRGLCTCVPVRRSVDSFFGLLIIDEHLIDHCTSRVSSEGVLRGVMLAHMYPYVPSHFHGVGGALCQVCLDGGRGRGGGM